jgi:hypothetical protein
MDYFPEDDYGGLEDHEVEAELLAAWREVICFDCARKTEPRMRSFPDAV